MERCIVDYSREFNPLPALKKMGVTVAYQNFSSFKIVALVPEEKIEELRRLEGIVGVTPEPLTLD